MRKTFIALEHDFAGFRNWGSLRLSDLRAQGSTHVAGDHRLYVNALPVGEPHEFPVGTMIVKQVEAGKPLMAADTNTAGASNPGDAPKEAVGQIFAMVKRGGDFNAQGAKGWEWFELKEREDGSAAILWRGLGAPKGEEYGGDPLGTCNTCHAMSQANDFVKSIALAANARAR